MKGPRAKVKGGPRAEFKNNNAETCHLCGTSATSVKRQEVDDYRIENT